MAKELPYFRFTVQEWQNGNISLERYELQGFFISLCGYYWLQDCTTTLAMLHKKFSNATAMLQELIDLGIIKHEKRHDKVEIVFLNKQYDLLSENRKARQDAGSKGGKAKAKLKQKPSYKDKDNNKDKDNIVNDIVSFLNIELGTDFKPTTKVTVDLINARIKEGYTFDDFKKAITTKKANWYNTDMAMYLRPSTLFGNKFESYLNESIKNTGITISGLPVEAEYEYFDSYASVWRNYQAFKNAFGYAPKEDTPKRLKK